MHNVRTHDDATWTNGGSGGYVTIESDWEDLDRKFFGAWNGDRGGTWAPSTPIVIGDVGNPASASLVVSGLAKIAYGGSLTTRAGSRFYLSSPTAAKLGANHVGRKRTTNNACVKRQATPPYSWITVPSLAAIQSIACTVAIKEGGQTVSNDNPYFPMDASSISTTSLLQPSFHLPLDVHDGSRFVRATFTFRVGTPRTASPVAMPKFRVVAIDQDGNVSPLKKTSDGSGYASPDIASSGDSWYAGGAVQSFVYECDQNQTVDTSRFTYEAQVVEEVGVTSFPIAIAGDAFNSVKADGILVGEKKSSVIAASIANLSSLSGLFMSDGSGTSLLDGVRVLVKDQTDPTTNGIYNAHAGSWTRAGDADQAEDFTPGFLVGVGGDGTIAPTATSQLGQVWQFANTPPINLDLGATKLFFRRRIPAGNIYHAVSCDFDSIADLRFP